jgi:hypothetical protein
MMLLNSIRTTLRFLPGFVLQLLLILLAVTCLGIEITVADSKLILPVPDGFSDIKNVSSETFRTMQDVTPETNRLLAGFVTSHDASLLLRGQEAELDRYFMVQTFIEFEKKVFSTNEFSEFRKLIRKQQDSSTLISQDKIDALTKKGSENLSNRYNADISFEINGTVPLGVSNETANSIAISTLMKYDESIDNNKSESILASTTVFLLVNGKLLYLYVYATYETVSDLEWTRDIAKTWSSQIVSSNGTSITYTTNKITNSNVQIPTKIKELLAGPRSTYSTKGHSKSLGLDISISYPSSWEAKEGARPHIVQKFNGKILGSISPSFLILIQEYTGWESVFLDQGDWEELLDEFITDMVPAEGTLLSQGKTHLDGEPSVWIKYYTEQERSGMSLGMFMFNYVVIYQGKMIMLQCNVSGLIDDYLVLEESFNTYLPVFQDIGNSLIINNKWDGSSESYEPFSQYWLFTLALSALLTWGIGLLPPLVTRFIILRRCLSRQASTIFSISFLVLNIIAFTVLGSESKTHAALFLVALASFAILRIGSGEDDKERERVSREREKRQWEEQAKRAQDDARRTEEERQFKQKHAQERERAERERQDWEQQANRAREDARTAKEERLRKEKHEREHAKAENERKQWEEQANRARMDAAAAQEAALRLKQEDEDSYDRRTNSKDAKYHANVLGLKGSVTKYQIKKRYRELTAKYHPDRVVNMGEKLKLIADNEMKAINESYDFLKKKYKL